MEPRRTVLLAMILVVCQLAAGAAACRLLLRSRKRAGPVGVVTVRAAGRLVPAASFLALLLLAMGMETGLGDVSLESWAGLAGWAGWAFGALGAITTCGGYLLLFAGSLERRGALRVGRKTARRAGLGAAAAAGLQVAVCLVAWLGSASSVDGATENVVSLAILATCMSATAAAGIGALLAGLAGKPRPTAYAVALFLLAAALTWAAGWQPAG